MTKASEAASIGFYQIRNDMDDNDNYIFPNDDGPDSVFDNYFAQAFTHNGWQLIAVGGHAGGFERAELVRKSLLYEIRPGIRYRIARIHWDVVEEIGGIE